MNVKHETRRLNHEISKSVYSTFLYEMHIPTCIMFSTLPNIAHNHNILFFQSFVILYVQCSLGVILAVWQVLKKAYSIIQIYIMNTKGEKEYELIKKTNSCT
jgi:hypothetical protein